MRNTSAEKLRCSFCNKTKDEVRKLIKAEHALICDVCIEICNDTLLEEGVFPNPNNPLFSEKACDLYGLDTLTVGELLGNSPDKGTTIRALLESILENLRPRFVEILNCQLQRAEVEEVKAAEELKSLVARKEEAEARGERAKAKIELTKKQLAGLGANIAPPPVTPVETATAGSPD